MSPGAPQLAILCAVLISQLATKAADWPHFLGPNYNGTSSETNLLHEFPKEGPPKLWEYPKGAGHSAPAVSGNRAVIFHTIDDKETIDGIDVITGERQWRFSYDAAFTSQFGGGKGPCSNPVIADGRVFTLGINSDLHCLDLASGKVLWRHLLAKEYKLLPTFFGQGGTPLVLGKSLIVSLGTEDGKSVVAFDVSSGKELWAARHPWGSSYASPVPATLHGRECILAFQGGMSAAHRRSPRHRFENRRGAQRHAVPGENVCQRECELARP